MLQLANQAGTNYGGAGGSSITIDATNSASVSANTTVTWSHTVSGSARVLFIGVATSYNGGPHTVSYGGVNLTEVTNRASNDSTYGGCSLWMMVDPPVGTATCAASVYDTSTIAAGSISLNGVDQTTPLQHTNAAVGASGDLSITIPSTTGNMVLDVACNGSGLTASGQTPVWLINIDGNSAAGNGAQSTANGASSVTMSYTATSDFWSMIAVDIKAQ